MVYLQAGIPAGADYSGYREDFLLAQSTVERFTATHIVQSTCNKVSGITAAIGLFHIAEVKRNTFRRRSIADET